MNEKTEDLEIIVCDYCDFAGLFHCTHPQNYIQPFKEPGEYCELIRALPKGEMRVKVDYNVSCSICKGTYNINEMYVGAKGSKFVCKNCKTEH